MAAIESGGAMALRSTEPERSGRKGPPAKGDPTEDSGAGLTTGRRHHRSAHAPGQLGLSGRHQPSTVATAGGPPHPCARGGLGTRWRAQVSRL